MEFDPLDTELKFMINDELPIKADIINNITDIIWTNGIDIEHNSDITIKWINEFIIIDIFDYRMLQNNIKNK